MKVFIRSDASYKIGSGHVMRCLTLAQQLKEKGASVSFISRLHAGNLNEFIREQGFICLDLSNPVQHPLKIINPKNEYETWLAVSSEVDAEETLALIGEENFLLLIDHYGLDQNWEEKFKAHFKYRVVIDDLANRAHDCELLIDQNVHPEIHARYPELVPQNCRLLLGPHYALLRPNFFKLHQNLNKHSGKLENIFLFFGGNDAGNETLKALNSCLKLKFIQHIDLVVGAMNPHGEALRAQSLKDSRIHLYKNVEEMGCLMLKADLALGAGGVTTWERACLGLPALAWSLAANQEPLLKALHQQEVLYYLGRCEEVNEEKVMTVLQNFYENPKELVAMSSKAQSLVDGQGAPRVCQEIFALGIILRKVVLSDKKNIFEWRNHPATRHFSHDSKTISWEEHESWFEKSLLNPARVFLIAEKERTEIGVLRFDLSENEAFTSIYLVPGKLGQGYGTPILLQGMQWIQKRHPEIRLLKAEIQEENKASQKAFTKAGYQLENKIWVKTL